MKKKFPILNFKFSILNSQLSTSKGFTLPELIVTMAVFALLVGFATINLTGARHQASIQTAITTLNADIKEQQIKAMVGDTQNQATADSYGIYFQVNKYILFKGSTYSSGNTQNFSILLDPALTFSTINLPNSSIVFSNISGEIAGFSSSSHSIILKNTQTNQQYTITINKYGALQ